MNLSLFRAFGVVFLSLMALLFVVPDVFAKGNSGNGGGYRGGSYGGGGT